MLEEVWRRDEDVAITGFDDFHLAHLMPVPLTLITYSATELGCLGAEMLFHRIDGDTSPSRRVIMSVRLETSGRKSATSGT